MSQAYNLGKFANTLNSSGQIDPATGLVNQFPTTNLPTIPINKGGTNLTTVGANGTILGTDGSAYTYGSASGALTWAAVQTSSFTASAGYGYLVNTTSSTITVTLPSSPTIGQTVVIVDYAGTAATNNITISPNGSKINAGLGSILIQTNREGLTLVYIDSTQGWLSQSNVYKSGTPFTQQIPITYLVVAGGGGTGFSASGGGGAGGYLTNTFFATAGTVYTATVGGGGGGAASGNGTAGTNSSLSGSGLTTITSIGGGYGSNGNSGNGGSGGGGGNGASQNPGTGTAGQGNNGGRGLASPQNGGGGGGAGAVGSNATSSATAATGGNGLQSSITGTATYYAGGGGGGQGVNSSAGGAGGLGGGGTGGGYNGTGPTNGTANTGGGGGGSYYPQAGGSGGSGVVILSIPTAQYSGTSTGSPTITTSGSNTILKFTSSGTYTA